MVAEALIQLELEALVAAEMVRAILEVQELQIQVEELAAPKDRQEPILELAVQVL